MDERKTPPEGGVEARLAALERRVADLECDSLEVRMDVDDLIAELPEEPPAVLPLPLDAQLHASRPA